MKIANKGFFREKKPSKFSIFEAFFSKAKTKECDRSNLSVSDKFGMITPFSATFVLEMSAQVSLKVANKGSFRDKKPEKTCIFEAIFLKQKWWSAFKTI